jgi:hypothetical protein
VDLLKVPEPVERVLVHRDAQADAVGTDGGWRLRPVRDVVGGDDLVGDDLVGDGAVASVAELLEEAPRERLVLD